MYSRHLLNLALLSIALIFSPGCMEKLRKIVPLPAPAERPVIETIPLNFEAPLTVVAGSRYANLFDTSQSYSLWVTNEVAEAKLNADTSTGEVSEGDKESDLSSAVEINENFLTFECHLTSTFNDPSVAHDIVKLSEVDVELLTPSGGRLVPAARIMGSLSVDHQSALPTVSRTNLLIFRRRDASGREIIYPGITEFAISLLTYESEYRFVWEFADRSTAVSRANISIDRLTRIPFRQYFAWVRQALTHFQ